MEAVTEGDHEVYAYSATPDASRVALAISTTTSIGDLYVLDTATRRMTKLTGVNDELFSQLHVTPPEMICYKSFDGRRCRPGCSARRISIRRKNIRCILNIHGGPHAAYGYTFDHEFHWMSAKGYLVLYPNPRGSTTYGQEFGNIIQFRYPGDDFKDLMAGVDDLMARGSVDGQRMGVTGGSGGGVLTNWVIGHTDVFKAAVSQRSIADWSAFWYTADFAQFRNEWFRGAPWETGGRLQSALADHLYRQDQNAADIDRRRGRLAHSVRRRRRADVPRLDVPQDTHRDGAVSR